MGSEKIEGVVLSLIFCYHGYMKSVRIPASFQGTLWSANVKNLNAERDKNYIVHHILMYGTLEQIRWLIRAYGADVVKKIFLEHPQKIYTPSAFHFAKMIILEMRRARVNPSRYVAKPIA